jgi:hypothetical protein
MFDIIAAHHGSLSNGDGGIEARSVIFDILNNWASGFMGVRSIEFKLGGVTIANASPTAYATSTGSSSLEPEFAFDTTLPKTGDDVNNSWRTPFGKVSNQRLIVVFDSETNFDEIVINNGHDFGGSTDRGAKITKITVSTDAITDTTYNAPVSNSTVLNNTEWPQHIASDVVDDQTVWTYA